MKQLINNGDYFSKRIGFVIEDRQYPDEVSASLFLQDKCGMDNDESKGYLRKLRLDGKARGARVNG